ncbi:MAG TPA: Panacea domain-containing protein [Saprospiraceae bacterium]|nr:Panacea domain-containing protein [Saprospiraceae bacterium]HND87979.1 Panacea domain-containing protein [Saprospiraceae bacterium]
MFRALLNDKIGTVVRHFAAQIPHLSLTKLLKLLYITDETAMRETGTPITWLEYRVWKRGPVPAEIYQEIKHGEKMTIGGHLVSLDDYIQVKKQESPRRPGQEEVFIEAKGEDDLSMLSDYEIQLLHQVIGQFGSMNAGELVNFLHEEGSLWHKAVQEHKLDTNFELFQNTSNCIIDFSELIEDDEFMKMVAQSAFESLSFHKAIYETKLQQNA